MGKKTFIVGLVLALLLLSTSVYSYGFIDALKDFFSGGITGSAVLSVSDCDPSHKIIICHVPPGNPENSRILCVDANGWNGHDNHPDDIYPIKDLSKDDKLDDIDCVMAATGTTEVTQLGRPSLSLDPTDASGCRSSAKIIISNSGTDDKDDAEDVMIAIYPVSGHEFFDTVDYNPYVGDIGDGQSSEISFKTDLSDSWQSAPLGSEVKIKAEIISEANWPGNNNGKSAYYTIIKSAEEGCNYGSACSPEVCDSIDNDCDGTVDEDLTKQCGESDLGVCTFGTEICSDGHWGECVGAVVPDIEICNSLDDDCDGLSDEELTQVCGTNIGQCNSGTQTCVAGSWSDCSGTYVPPSDESCDGVDNDCDGEVDELSLCECDSGEQRPCGSDTGICETGIQSCSFGKWGACNGGIGPADEICNGLDDDCDGLIDEELTESCEGNIIGECSPGTRTCESGVWSSCSGVVSPTQEVCDSKDNDCDGDADESLISPCGVSDIGACKYGTMTCSQGLYGTCVGAVYPSGEICGNGIDEDCNGMMDDAGCITSLQSLSGGCPDITITKPGRVKITLTGASAVLISDVYMSQPSDDLLIPDNLKNIGAVTEDQYPLGTTFAFYIKIHGEPMGLGTYNHYSDSIFCKEDILGENKYRLNFEDLPENRADWDYNDVVMIVELFEDNGSCILNELCDGKDNNCNQLIDESLTKDCGTSVGECRQGSQTCSNATWGGCIGQILPTAEICDAKDNDCDGLTDEELSNECGSDIGQCKKGTKSCLNGVWSTCTGQVAPANETCDGTDNDCDGETDEGCSCITGQTRNCGETIGECSSGTQTCADGIWGECAGMNGPSEEICDGKDNDCDGQTDENLNRACPGESVGVCAPGQQSCVDGSWGECIGKTDGSEEVCDNLDNDCDGTVDESLMQLCGTDIGECESGIMVCADGQWGSCMGAVGGSTEVCDGIDNDCDSDIDEDLVKECGSDVGQCEKGLQSCVIGTWGECVWSIGPNEEICDNIDNDCDGIIDDDLTQICGTDIGECRTGDQICVAGVWGECTGGYAPDPEVCDGKDNNCDGLVDNGIDCTCVNGEVRPCGTDLGECTFGSQTCSNGQWGTCIDGTEAAVETCDGLDNDCDGVIDDGITRNCGISDIGECSFGTQICAEGLWGNCSGSKYPTAELCNGIDDDCNGFVDEGLIRTCGISNESICRFGEQICEVGNWSDCVGNVDPAPEVCDGIDNDCDAFVDNNITCGEGNGGGGGGGTKTENKTQPEPPESRRMILAPLITKMLASCQPGDGCKEGCVPSDPDCPWEELDIRIIGAPNSVDITDDKLYVEAVVWNRGSLAADEVTADITTSEGWVSQPIYIGRMESHAKKTVVYELKSTLCTKQSAVGDRYYDLSEIELTVYAKSFGDERDSESTGIPLNIPTLSVTSAKTDYSTDNTIRACFFVNNIGKDIQEKYELEIEMSDQKNDLFIDYLSPIITPQNTVLIKTTDYKLSSIPRKKPYYMRAGLYSNGSIFTDAYKIGEDRSVVDLSNIGFKLTGFKAWLSEVKQWFSRL